MRRLKGKCTNGRQTKHQAQQTTRPLSFIGVCLTPLCNRAKQ
ncbi:hypothetical protein GCWU000325_01477 [Alloprevotella tannerae ATCC 51259]|uniref:Uncharacterized protein n=1 Tax=Alloprevotella tannerae ATCC 51259 TaxID=626522 RepID=C9LGX6_9BACT|nr:hypothetical protein GCWU000325_01477 [Alloprevotella tannerae ATCC 51259]